jgi:hypothetical protein
MREIRGGILDLRIRGIGIGCASEFLSYRTGYYRKCAASCGLYKKITSMRPQAKKERKIFIQNMKNEFIDYFRRNHLRTAQPNEPPYLLSSTKESQPCSMRYSEITYGT